MDEHAFDPAHTALVLIDLQNSNVSRQLAPYSAEQTVGNCVLLAQEMRGRGARLPAAPTAGIEAQDTVITKRQWGAFYGTELDQLLRRRGINTLVLGGIATNFGVESTARAAFDRGYALVFAEDAMSSFEAEAHAFACRTIFPRMGRVRSTRTLIDMWQAGTGPA